MAGLTGRGPVRVLVVDDSLLFQDALSRMLSCQPGIVVVGTASDGQEALTKTKQLNPDLITMDIWMPSMDGLQAIERIMADQPTPILVLTEDDSAGLAFKALERGALDLVRKSSILDTKGINELCGKIRLMYTIKVVRHMAATRRNSKALPILRRSTHMGSVVAIAGSTGGPKALHVLISSLPADFPAAILVVQHIAEGFTASLADWLDLECPMRVRLAGDGDRLEHGVVLVAPDHFHMKVNQDGHVGLEDSPPVDGHRPSATMLFRSVAKVYGAGAVGLVMTGMGRDGADGMQDIYEGGGVTITQDEQSSVVYGMPRAANELGVIQMRLPLEDISKMLMRIMRMG